MDFSTFYNMYSDIMSDAKMTVIKIFLDTFIKYPPIGIFFTWLILRRPAKAAAEFIKRFA